MRNWFIYSLKVAGLFLLGTIATAVGLTAYHVMGDIDDPSMMKWRERW